MQLVSLTINREGQVLREITFKKGLNLILDKPTTAGTESGNNVGKTTVLRLIDYCLGAEGDEIWQDPEFKGSINQDVYDLLHDTPAVYITLNTADKVRGSHSLRRSFKVNGRKRSGSFHVDEVPLDSITAYREAVKNILFGSTAKKPGLRQLIPKFVRSSNAVMGKTLKFLGSFASEVEYEAVDLFLFGFFNVGVLEERATLTDKRSAVARDLIGATRVRKEGEIEQLLLHLRREIDETQAFIDLRGEVPEIAEAANSVSAVRAEASEVGGALGHIEGEIASINLAIASLKNDYENIDVASVKSIYSEAGKYHAQLQHDWEELCSFVASLRGRKERFLQRQLGELSSKAAIYHQALAGLQVREENLMSALRQTRAFEFALEVRAGLQEKLKQLGGLEESLNTIQSLRTSLAWIDEKLEKTRSTIEEGKAQLTKRVAMFNEFFTALSKELYGEQYLLTFDESKDGSIVFSLTSVGANVGAGKKVSQTAAFDIAYIKFLHAAGINFPTFVCHDGVEAVHGNQLSALLTIANTLDGQLVLAAIRDKLPGISETFLEENTILELSQDDRLFRI